jgi:serine/threonine protein kinase
MAGTANALAAELQGLDPQSALSVVSKWLAQNKMDKALQALKTDAGDHSKFGGGAGLPAKSAPTPQPVAPPVGEALPVPGTSTRPGRLFDAEPIDPATVPEQLLTKPDPVFFGERDDKRREANVTEEFPLMVHFDALTSGLESETHFRVEEQQIIAGRYVVIQYLGSGTFCHTVQCEDLQGRGANRFVCVKVSKNTKDILDQNLWEVKLLKLLARRVSDEEKELLPTLLNVFYYRETLFIVYELLRDNLYHIYKYIEECKLPKYFTADRLREVSRQCLQTLCVLHSHDVIHCDLKPENILISSLTSCQVKVIDYGNAYLHHDQRCSYVQSRAYRAPEVVLGHPYTPKVDLWSLGCILMELLTDRLLFDNRSVQSLLASHIALLGAMPQRLLSEGQLSDHYFPDDAADGSPQTLIGKHEGRICRLRPTVTSLAALCERHGCTDPDFPDFIRALLALDPYQRVTAEEALRHPFIAQHAAGQCPPYRLAPGDRSGEAGLRLLEKYKSLENVESPARGGRASFDAGGLLREEDVPGPATPTSFREQCYKDREKQEKKSRSRKSGLGRWSMGGGGGGADKDAGGELPSMDGMVISTKK